ncbi:MAG: cation:proton antiporter [Rhizobiaceae bacterium]|nr:cation:proton antiporter [Rhizobiaceae bacterium]
MTEFVTGSAFAQIAALLAIASIIGLIGMVLRQPLIVSFIVVGLVAGPSVLDLVHAEHEIELLSELGIAVLLFLVGLKLDVGLIRSLGTVSLISGAVQVTATTTIGFLIALAAGLGSLESLYVGIGMAFSSTIIVVKMLSDKREIDALHGQLALGFLIVQDLVVVLAMITLSALGVGTGEEGSAGDAVWVLLAGFALLAFVIVFVRFIAEPLTDYMARVPELLICFAIALAAIFAAVSDTAGLGKEIGGLMAGVALASTRYREAIGSRLAPLRDFLLLFFFVSLGAEIDLRGLTAALVPALVLSLFVLIGKPLIVMSVVRFMNFRKRTGFQAGVALAQISEFSLILAGLGLSLGHLSKDTLGLITLVGLITIAVSSYMISFCSSLYKWLEPLLGVFERANPGREIAAEGKSAGEAHDVVLLGLGRYGTAIGLRLKRRGLKVLGVDFNPAAVRRGRSHGLDVEYGDASDPEFVRHLPLDGVNWVVSTVPVHETGLIHGDPRAAIVHALKQAGFQGQIAVASHRDSELDGQIAAGADLVLEPFQDAADQAADLLTGERVRARLEIDHVAGEIQDRPVTGGS